MSGLRLIGTPSVALPLRLVLFLVLSNVIGYAQNDWGKAEIAKVFDGIDVSGALEAVKAKGLTPYDFGIKLLDSGQPDQAKKWFVAVGIETGDVQYVYGLAWCKWITGDNHGALVDAEHVLGGTPSPLIQARTHYLLGGIAIDEEHFDKARLHLTTALEGYSALDKVGGQFLCLSSLAACAVFERKLDEVVPFLERAYVANENLRDKGIEPFSQGRRLEIIGEMRFAQADYEGSLQAVQESIEAYRAAGSQSLADELQAKVGLLLVMTGKPKAAKVLATGLSRKFHKDKDRGRLNAYLSAVKMKLCDCAQKESDARDNERAARSWANASPSGKSLIRLIEWVKDVNNVPCPKWE